MLELKLIPKSEFDRILSTDIEIDKKLSLLADMCRMNALTVVKRAGSGHLGSSFSSMEIMVLLYFHLMNVKEKGVKDPDRDIFFSSKGHDVPALYSILYALGILPEEKFINLRRIAGVEGHPDVATVGMEVCSGSLGMGISKAHGMMWAKQYNRRSGELFVLTGDGELQEGQNYEALQNIAHKGTSGITVIVDHNKVQSDKYVKDILDLGDLNSKFQTFGWHVERCKGNSILELLDAFRKLAADAGRPGLLIADTIKGSGVSFMEHTNSMPSGSYPWHSGAPKDDDYVKAREELLAKVQSDCKKNSISEIVVKLLPLPPAYNPAYSLEGEPVSLKMPVEKISKTGSEFVAAAFGDALVDIAGQRKDVIVLDADLAADCRVRAFELKYPDRFIECGIAEQDMVSMAGGLARQGLLPVVNSFASFLASRANEQIYNNACEKTKIIYALHYAGVIPAGPGKSHQSIRDISLLGALPNMEIIQPCCAEETSMAVKYAVNEASVNVAIRLIIGPSPRRISLPAGYGFRPGAGAVLNQGKDAVLIAYGPVMLHEALLASEILETKSFGLKVINMPWLNRIDTAWLAGELKGFKTVYVQEDHSPFGGLGDRILDWLNGNGLSAVRMIKCGVEGFPVHGTPWESLAYHGLDGQSIANRVLKYIDK